MCPLYFSKILLKNKIKEEEEEEEEEEYVCPLSWLTYSSHLCTQFFNSF